MKYLFLILFSIFSIALNANEINDSEFPLIMPVSVEKASVTVKKVSTEVVEEPAISDEDADGVLDEDDKCPKTKSGIVVDESGCEIDSDADGVADSIDECPDTQDGFIVDEAGCAQIALLKLNFDIDKYDITSEHLTKVEEFAAFLEENADYNVIIYGHTDITGSEEHNELLSKNRAQSVMDTLVEFGISETRLTSIGMSSKNPVADNDTDEGLAQNRRVEVEIIK